MRYASSTVGTAPLNLTVRPYRDDDLEDIVELTNAADAVDRLHLGTTAEELRGRLHSPHSDPRQEVLVAQDRNKRIVAYARLELKSAPRQNRLYVHGAVHPDWREQEVQRLLLERMWQKAQERRHSLGSKPAQFRTYCAAHQENRTALFESFGLRPVRYSPHMVCHALDNLAEPSVPPGLQVRPYVRGRDDGSALETVNQAYADIMDYAPATLEELRHWTASPSFREELSAVALDVQEVVGLSLCTVNEGRMRLVGRKDVYVDTLAVHPAYRRRGLGSALLLASLHSMKQAGMESATLDTDTDNPTEAIRLYERVGFRELWRWVTYSRNMQ